MINCRRINTGDITAEYSNSVGFTNFLHKRNLKIKPNVSTEKLQSARNAAGLSTPFRYILMRTMTQKYVLRASAMNMGERTTHQLIRGITSSTRRTTRTSVINTAVSHMNIWNKNLENKYLQCILFKVLNSNTYWSRRLFFFRPSMNLLSHFTTTIPVRSYIKYKKQ